MLNLQVANLEREVAVTRKLLPQIAQYESEIVSMQNHLMFERKRVDKLSRELGLNTVTKLDFLIFKNKLDQNHLKLLSKVILYFQNHPQTQKPRRTTSQTSISGRTPE